MVDAAMVAVAMYEVAMVEVAIVDDAMVEVTMVALTSATVLYPYQSPYPSTGLMYFSLSPPPNTITLSVRRASELGKASMPA